MYAILRLTHTKKNSSTSQRLNANSNLSISLSLFIETTHLLLSTMSSLEQRIRQVVEATGAKLTPDLDKGSSDPVARLAHRQQTFELVRLMNQVIPNEVQEDSSMKESMASHPFRRFQLAVKIDKELREKASHELKPRSVADRALSVNLDRPSLTHPNQRERRSNRPNLRYHTSRALPSIAPYPLCHPHHVALGLRRINNWEGTLEPDRRDRLPSRQRRHLAAIYRGTKDRNPGLYKAESPHSEPGCNRKRNDSTYGSATNYKDERRQMT